MRKRLKDLDKKMYKNVSFFTFLIVIAGCIAFVIFGIANEEPAIALPCILGTLVLVTIIWEDFILAGYFYSVALIKGYKDTKYLKIAFYIPLVGYLLVIALPDRGAAAAKSQANAYAQQPNTYTNDPRES